MTLGKLLVSWCSSNYFYWSSVFISMLDQFFMSCCIITHGLSFKCFIINFSGLQAFVVIQLSIWTLTVLLQLSNQNLDLFPRQKHKETYTFFKDMNTTFCRFTKSRDSFYIAHVSTTLLGKLLNLLLSSTL